MRAFPSVVLTLFLAACGCTAVGCANRIHFDLPVDVVSGSRYLVHVCFDDACHDGTLTAPDPYGVTQGILTLSVEEDWLEFELGSGDFGGSHKLTLSLHDEGGADLAHFDKTVELKKFQPNGPLCGPTCWSADFEL